jgi:hypothetical protein
MFVGVLLWVVVHQANRACTFRKHYDTEVRTSRVAILFRGILSKTRYKSARGVAYDQNVRQHWNSMLNLSNATSATDIFFKTYNNPDDITVLRWVEGKGTLLPLISYEGSTQFGTMNVALEEIGDTYDWTIVARTDVEYSGLLLDLVRTFDFQANQNWITVINTDHRNRVNDILFIVPGRLKKQFMQAVTFIGRSGLSDLHTLGLVMRNQVRCLSHVRGTVREQNPFYTIDGMVKQKSE